MLGISPAKPFQSSLVFASWAAAYLSEAPFSCPHKVRLLALPTNIRLGWKGLLRANSLAFGAIHTVTMKK